MSAMTQTEADLIDRVREGYGDISIAIRALEARLPPAPTAPATEGPDEGQVERAWQSLLDTATDVTTRDDVRAALIAAGNAAPVFSRDRADALAVRLAEMLYDDQTGTRGKFVTSGYRDVWVRRVRSVVDTWSSEELARIEEQG